eukprot:600108-Pleurochrysis_carterae.AAC.1
MSATVQQALVYGVVQQVVRGPAADSWIIVNRVRGVFVAGEEGCDAIASTYRSRKQKKRALAVRDSLRGGYELPIHRGRVVTRHS